MDAGKIGRRGEQWKSKLSGKESKVHGSEMEAGKRQRVDARVDLV